MASPKNDRRHSDEVGGKYNGKSYKKPRRMKPRNMDYESVSEFNKGHVKEIKKKKK